MEPIEEKPQPKKLVCSVYQKGKGSHTYQRKAFGEIIYWQCDCGLRLVS